MCVVVVVVLFLAQHSIQNSCGKLPNTIFAETLQKFRAHTSQKSWRP